MQNRHDRNYDPGHGSGRRDDRDNQRSRYSRDEDDRRYGERGEPWRSNEGSFRAGGRQNWSSREVSGHEYAGRWPNAARFREHERDDDDYERSSWEHDSRQRGRDDDWYSRPQGSSSRNPDVRGYYQEQHWTRDPSTGNLYGYEYTTRLDPRFGDRDDAPRRERLSAWNDASRNSNSWRSDRWSSGDRSPPERWRRWDRPEAYRGSQRQLGSHYGKGPKGYVRSDERIREDVCDRLSDDDEVDASEVTVAVKDGEVTLEGSVSDRHSKHRAEDIAESVSGVRDVTNKLRTKKGLLRELGEKLIGDDEIEHRGHTGSGTRNSPSGIGNRGSHSH